MLTSKQRQYLKAQAHKLKPVMHVGKGGVTPAQAAELDVMVDSLELVKVKINPNSFEDEDTAAKALCASVSGLEHEQLAFFDGELKAMPDIAPGR